MKFASAVLILALVGVPQVSLAQTPGVWTVKAPMLSARKWHAAAAIGNNLYVAGGSTIAGDGISNTLEVYDSITNTWTAKASMPTARNRVKGAALNGLFYVVGGSLAGGTALGTVEAYNPATNTWSTKASMLTPRAWAATTVVGGKLYAIGGNNWVQDLTTVEMYDPSTNSWTTRSSLPVALRQHDAVAISGKIYVAGTGANTLYIYDPATNSWSSKTFTPGLLTDVGLAVMNGYLYVIGGFDGTSARSEVWQYDPESNAWTQLTALSSARYGIQTGVINGSVYAVGGAIATGTSAAPLTTNVALRLLLSSVPAPPGYTISTAVGPSVITEGGSATAQPMPELGAIARDSSGNLYIVAPDRNKIFKLSTSGNLSTFAGTGLPGAAGDGGPAASGQLWHPQGIAIDSSGNLFIADTYNRRIRRVAAGTGILTTIAGTGYYGGDGDGGPALFAQFINPTNVAVDGSGNVFVADDFNRVRKIDAGGSISAFAGTSVLSLTGTYGVSSGDGGQALLAGFSFIRGLATDSSSNLYVIDQNQIRKIVASTGVINTVAGDGGCCHTGDNGPATAASLQGPDSVAIDSAGNIFIADLAWVRKVTFSTGIITTIAGSGSFDFSGDGGPPLSAAFRSLEGIALDNSGNIYLSDGRNNRVRKIQSNVIQTIVGSGPPGFLDGPATTAQLNYPAGLAADSAGNLFIADSTNNRIRRVSKTGVVSTIAGTGVLTVTQNGFTSFSGDGGPATSAQLLYPNGIAVDASGNIYFADLGNERIRKISTDGTITTIAGNGNSGTTGDNGPAISASLQTPSSVAVDSVGNVYIGDSSNRVRRVSPGGTITTFAGTGNPDYSGDGGPAASAGLDSLNGIQIAIDSFDTVYISEGSHIRNVTNGIIQTFSTQYAGSIAVGRDSNIYISQFNRVDRVKSDGSLLPIANGNYASGFWGDGGPALFAGLFAGAIATGPQGEIYVADFNDHVIRKLTPQPDSISMNVFPLGLSLTTNTATSTSLSIQFDSSASLDWTASAVVVTPAGGNWLSVGPSGGIGDSYLSVFANAQGLSAGTYNGTVTLTANNAANGPIAIPVTLIVPGAGLQTDTDVIVAIGSVGQASPGPRTFVISNASTGSALSFTDTRSIITPAGGNWFSVSPGSGNTAGTLTVTFNTTGLAAGSYVGKVTATAATGSIVVPVILKMQTPPTSLRLSKNWVYLNTPFAGQNPENQSIDIFNGGQGTLNWTATASSTGNWLIVDPNSGIDNDTLQVSAVAGSLAYGTYKGTITITAAGAVNSPLILPVIFRVGDTITGPYTISTIAGSTQFVEGGAAASQSLTPLSSVAVDGAGNLYIAEPQRHRILKVSTNGNIITFAGTGKPGPAGDGGPAASAQLNLPSAVAVDASGNVYIADSWNHRIRKVTAGTGIIRTIAGTLNQGFSGDGGPGTQARLSYPNSVAVDGVGNVYVGDVGNYRIRRITSAGIITTVAGNGGTSTGVDNVPATSTSVSYFSAIASDTAGNIFIAVYNRLLRVSVSTGIISTIAGPGNPGLPGDGGPATSAFISYVTAVSTDASGNIYLADSGKIRKIDTTGTIDRIAGTGGYDLTGDGGPALNAEFRNPGGLAANSSGDLFIADSDNHRIRKVTVSDGKVQTVVGNGSPGFSGDGTSALSARFNYPYGVATDLAGNVYVADENNQVVRKIATNGIVTTVAGTPGVNGFDGDGDAATFALLSFPQSVAVDAVGNLYIADTDNGRIRKVDLQGNISTVAGGGNCCSSGNGDGGLALDAVLSNPGGVAVDVNGVIYIADSANNRIRKVDLDGVITTIAGTGDYGADGDGGPALSAQLARPTKLALDSAGNLHIGDSYGNRLLTVDGTLSYYGNGYGIVAVDPADQVLDGYNCSLSEAYSPIAGITCGYTGDGGAALAASINVGDVSSDFMGNIFFSDYTNHVVRKLTPIASTSTVLTSYTQGIDVSVSRTSPTKNVGVYASVTGSGDPSWTASASVTTPSGGHWLLVSPGSGASFANLGVLVDATGLSSGIYNGAVTLSSPQSANGSLLIPVTVNVWDSDNPLPTLSSITPGVVAVSFGDTTITLNGTNFIPGSIAQIDFGNYFIDLSTTFSDATHLSAVVPGYLLSIPRSLNIRVNTLDPGGGVSVSRPLTVGTLSTPATLNDLNATPPGLSQTVAPAYGGPFALTLRGSNFVNGAVARIGSTDLQTSFVSSTELTVMVGAPVLALVGSGAVSVVNPGAAPSNGYTMFMVVRGDTNGNRRIDIGDALVCALTVGGVNRPSLPLSVGDLNLSGDVNIGDCLNGALFAGRVNANFSAPTVISTTPNPAIAGSTLTISGAGFSANASDNRVVIPTSTGWTRVMPSAASLNSLTVTLPNNAVSGAIQAFRVDSPLGGNEFVLTVSGSAVPLSLVSVFPYFQIASGASLTLSGSGFGPTPAGNNVQFKSSSGLVGATVNAASTTSLTVTIPGAAVCGPVIVGVGGQTSNARIVAVSGTNCGVQLVDIWGGGAPGDIVVLEGAGFDPVQAANNIVMFGNLQADVVAAGGTQLQVRIPAGATAGNVTVSVGGVISNSYPYSP